MQNYYLDPEKPDNDLRSNVKLQNLAELIGKDLLVQWNIKFKNFGKDKLNKNISAFGKSKPDLIITYKDKSALFDCYGKQSEEWIVDKHALKSFEKWQRDLNMPTIICFFVFNDIHIVIDRRFAMINTHKYSESHGKRSTKNKTAKFMEELPVFNKENLLKLIFN